MSTITFNLIDVYCSVILSDKHVMDSKMAKMSSVLTLHYGIVPVLVSFLSLLFYAGGSMQFRTIR